MKVSVCAAYNHIKHSALRGKTVVVIDVLRATTTIIQALKNGCRRVTPVETPEDAANIKRNSGDKNTILGGETDAYKISGFDFGNSPLEYEPGKVKGKNLILCTTNGTQAIFRAKEAEQTIICAFSNVSAAAKKAADYSKDIAIICAGTQGQLSAEDILAAGAFIERLEREGFEIEKDDLAIIAYNNYEMGRNDLNKALEGSYHFEYLKSIGFNDDIDFCLAEDTVNIVPEMYEDSISVKK